MLIIEKDDFTGLKKIHTPIFNLDEFNVFSDLSVMRSSQKLRKLDMKMKHDELSLRIQLGHDVDSEIKKLDLKNLNGFDLIYIEGEDGQGKLSIRVYSMLFEDCQWPSWYDEWPMIIDGNRISLTSNHISEHPVDLEFKVYDLPVDVFSTMANATEIKYSLRGKSDKIDGVLNEKYIKVFRAFETLCFGSEQDGIKFFEDLDLENNQYKGFLDKITEESGSSESEIINTSEHKTIERENEESFNKRINYAYRKVGSSHSAIKEYMNYYSLNFTDAKKQIEEKLKSSMTEDEWLNWKNKNKKGERNGMIFVGVIIVVLILLLKACF